MVTQPRSRAEIDALTKVIRAVIRRSVPDPHDAEELCHEALLRTLRATEGRLAGDALLAYATVVARNTVRSHHRAAQRLARRNARAAAAIDLTDAPADTALDEQLDPRERAALHQAVAQLSERDRELLGLIAEDVSIREAAAKTEATESTLRVRLHRARARARTRYVVALHRVELNDPRCLLVLDSLSAGDLTRQRSLHAAEHLETCPSCAQLVEPLLSRRRPVLAVIVAGAGVWQWIRRSPTHTASVVAAAGVGTASLIWLTQQPPAQPPAAPPSSIAAAASPVALRTPTLALLPVPPPATLTAHTGEPVTAAGATVIAVVGDEAFWVGTSDTDRILVVLTGTGESPQTITAGQHISFTGTLTANTADLAAQIGIDPSEGADLANQQGVHIEAAAATVTS